MDAKRATYVMTGLITLGGCGAVDVYGRVDNQGNIIARNGGFLVNHHRTDEFEIYRIRFEQDVSEAVINASAVSPNFDIGGHIVQLAMECGGQETCHDVEIRVPKGNGISFIMISE